MLIWVVFVNNSLGSNRVTLYSNGLHSVLCCVKITHAGKSAVNKISFFSCPLAVLETILP